VSGNNFKIRAADKSDAERMAVLHEQCFPNYWQHETFTDFFSVRGTFGLIAEAPQPVAMMVFRVLYEQADIITLAVEPAFRRQGIGRELLARAMAESAALGASKMFLDVEDGNVTAVQLYEKYGFSVIHRRKHYYRQKDGSFTDALVMTRKIG
jgi:[ribosomal protein S18]-alanine N-acetyltransferase